MSSPNGDLHSTQLQVWLRRMRQGDAGAHRVARAPDANGLTLHADLPRIGRRAPKNAQGHFASTGADQPREGHDLTPVDLETDVAVLVLLG